jgi:putative thioredoxin
MVEIEHLLEVGADQAAETKLTALIADEPANKEAVLMLAGLQIDDGRIEDATALLDTLPPSTDVDRLRAAASLSTAGGDVTEIRARLDADPADGSIRVELGRALAAVGEFEPALAELIVVVEDKGESADAARELMVDIFSLLGTEHPIVGAWRRRLASALY